MTRYFRTLLRVGCYVSIVFAFGSCSKNYFEGKILYSYKYLDGKGNDITNQMKDKADLEQHYFINAGNYLSRNEKGEVTQLYNSATNRYYFNVGMELQYVDAAKEFPKTFQPKSLRERQTILGFECKAVQVSSDAMQTTYFYSEKIKVNPAPFSKHRFGNWNKYLSYTKGALPLKFMIVSDRYTVTATAIQLTPMELSDHEFDVKYALSKGKTDNP